MKKQLFFVITLAAAMLTTLTVEAKTFVTIGTDSITSLYFPTGGAIAQIINQKRDEYAIQAGVEPTSGSIFNINAIISGEFEFGIVRSDKQYQAIKGLAEWRDKGPQQELRAVFSIHPESVTLVAALDAGIKDIKDLKGKKVNIGNPGSDQRQNALDALLTVGIDPKKDLKTESAKASEAHHLLQNDRIDAFFYTVSHPAEAIKKATSGARKVRFINITEIDHLLAQYPYYAGSIIPIALYPGVQNEKDIKTFGVKATFITSAKVADNTVYAITKEIFENLAEFKKLHPAFSTLTQKSMLEGLSAPIHPGALKYYQEAGLIK